MPGLILVMLGGAIGAGARHLVGAAFLARLGPGFPWSTLTVNLAGGLAMGLLAGWLGRAGGAEQARLFLGVGILGGFTTFSAFSLETWLLIERGQVWPAAGYVLASVLGSVALLFAGLLAMRAAA
ncbi:MAG: fluoride efflux transporter CrcB [Alphaproteobacteria bacterium]|nr:MAG: fluoride efflux transporter CrcB [Alphaproteobacteria bacterium]